jgi:glycerol-3-phosphate acyltransferase PlsY
MHYSVVILACAVAVVVVVKHRSNMRRLREGTERKIY